MYVGTFYLVKINAVYREIANFRWAKVSEKAYNVGDLIDPGAQNAGELTGLY